VEAAGFQGLDQFDTSAIEVLPQTTLRIEYLASLQPDTIVTVQFWVDQIGAGVLEGCSRPSGPNRATTWVRVAARRTTSRCTGTS